jgi:probable phosphoglycerate mutase
MTFLFVRHGESVANTLKLVSNRDLPHPLTEKGIAQTRSAGEALTARGVTKIYSSSILRAVQTAEILGDSIGVSVEKTDSLREYDCGELEGKGDEITWIEHAKVINSWLSQEDFEAHSRGGESFLDIERRFVPFIDFVRGNHDDSETIILVGHGGVLRAMLPLVAENLSFDFTRTAPMPNLIVIDTVWTPTGLVCRTWGGTPI